MGYSIDYNNYMYTNYLDLNLGWQGWKRVLTNVEQIEWKFPTTIINGWKQYGTQKVQFYKNPFGEVELIGSITGVLSVLQYLFLHCLVVIVLYRICIL